MTCFVLAYRYIKIWTHIATCTFIRDRQRGNDGVVLWHSYLIHSQPRLRWEGFGRPRERSHSRVDEKEEARRLLIEIWSTIRRHSRTGSETSSRTGKGARKLTDSEQGEPVVWIVVPGCARCLRTKDQRGLLSTLGVARESLLVERPKRLKATAGFSAFTARTPWYTPRLFALSGWIPNVIFSYARRILWW